MDYICLLPAEIAVEILILLALRDIISCMRVSRDWYNRIKILDSYWRHALDKLGLPLELCNAYMSRHSAGRRELALRVWKNRERLRSARPEVQLLTPSVPPHIYFQCNHAHYTTTVSTLYHSFSPQHIIVHRLQPGTGKLVQKHLFKPISIAPQSRIAWAYHFCDYLLLVTASGHWRGYDLAHDRLVLDWQGPSLFDSDLIFGCCDSCFMVGMGKLVSSRSPKESYWDIHLFRLGRGLAKPCFLDFRVYTSVYLNQSVMASMPKKLFLLSRTSQADEEGFCESHWLFLQSVEAIYVYQVKLPSTLMPTPLAKLDFHPHLSVEDAAMVLCDAVRNAAFTLSLDTTLLGCIISDELHIWRISSDNLVKESTVSIPRRNESSVCLLAVGHVYSILGYESAKGHFQVITTYRGDMVFSVYGFSGLGLESLSTVGTPPPYFTFLTITNEEWLSEVSSLPHPHFPFLLFWDKRRHSILGMGLNHGNVDGSSNQTITSQSTITNRWAEQVKEMFKIRR